MREMEDYIEGTKESINCETRNFCRGHWDMDVYNCGNTILAKIEGFSNTRNEGLRIIIGPNGTDFRGSYDNHSKIINANEISAIATIQRIIIEMNNKFLDARFVEGIEEYLEAELSGFCPKVLDTDFEKRVIELQNEDSRDRIILDLNGIRLTGNDAVSMFYVSKLLEVYEIFIKYIGSRI